VPKKRGPKTDVLEALLKRVDGLEKRLHTEGKSDDLDDLDPTTTVQNPTNNNETKHTIASPSQSRIPIDIAPNPANAPHHANQLMSPVEPRCADYFPEAAVPALLTFTSLPTPTLSPELLLDTYFARIHGKPYYILDEATTRQRLQANQLPGHLAYAIYAVGARYNELPLT
jgi:hypothetical protein